MKILTTFNVKGELGIKLCRVLLIETRDLIHDGTSAFFRTIWILSQKTGIFSELNYLHLGATKTILANNLLIIQQDFFFLFFFIIQ